MFCQNCKKENIIEGKLPFKATCKYCDEYLHSCKNCKYHQLGKPNDCYIIDIEKVIDKEKYNFCEDFKEKDFFEETKNSLTEDIEKKLFKGETSQTEKKSFEDLFKD